MRFRASRLIVLPTGRSSAAVRVYAAIPPHHTKTSIISLSIWVAKHTSQVMRKEEAIEPLIEINRIIMQGLSAQAGANAA